MKSARLDAALLFVGCSILYLLYLTPKVTFFDNAEFIACAHTLGVNHSPGYPLFTLLGKLFSILPGLPGDAGVRVNALNALLGGLAVGLFCAGLVEAGLPRSAAWTAALAFAFSRTFWAYSEHAKVYTLNAVLLDFTFLAVLRFVASGSTRALVACGVSSGLLLGNHNSMAFALPPLWLYARVRLATAAGRRIPPVVLAGAAALLFALLAAKFRGDLLPVFGLAALVAGLAANRLSGLRPVLTFPHKESGWQPRGPLSYSLAAAFLAFAAPYVWMLLRANQHPPMDFWSPTDLARLLDTVRMRSYDYMTTETGVAQTALQGSMYIRHFLHQFHPLMAPVVLALVALSIRGNAALSALAISGFAATSLGQLAVLNLSQYGPIMFAEVELWIIPSIWFACAGLGAGLLVALNLFRARNASIRLVRAVTIGAFLIPAAAFFHNRFYCDFSKNFVPYDYARNILASLPPRAVLLTHFEDTFLLWYCQLVEGIRPDSPVIVADLLQYDWYWKRHLPRRFPTLSIPADFLPDAEDSPEASAVVQRQRQRALVSGNTDRAFYTDNIELGRTGADFLLVPEGTVWRVATDAREVLGAPEMAAQNLASYAYRGILDGTGESRFAPDAVTRVRSEAPSGDAGPGDPGRRLDEGYRLYRVFENKSLVLDFRLDVYCQYVLNGYARECNFAGILMDRFGRKNDAVRLWELAQKLNPLDPNSAQNLNQASANDGSKKPRSSPDALLAVGLDYLQLGLARNAEALWKRSAATEPAAAGKALQNLASLAMQEGRTEDAKLFLTDLLRKDPKNADARQKLDSLSRAATR